MIIQNSYVYRYSLPCFITSCSDWQVMWCSTGVPTSKMANDWNDLSWPGATQIVRLGVYSYNIIFLFVKIWNITYIYGCYIDCTRKQLNILLISVVRRERYKEHVWYPYSLYIPYSMGSPLELLRVSQASNRPVCLFYHWWKTISIYECMILLSKIHGILHLFSMES